MAYPSFAQVSTLAHKYNVIPVCRTFLADTETPIGLFQKCRHDEYAFLLESVEGGTRWARYSFVGSNPFLVFTAKDGRIDIRKRHGEREVKYGNPLHDLEQLLEVYRCPTYEGFPPFLAGGVGSFGYEALRYMDELPLSPVDPLQSPDIHVMFCDRVLVFDHLKQQVIAVQLLEVPDRRDKEQLKHRYERTIKDLDDWIVQLRKHRNNHIAFPGRSNDAFIKPLKYRSNTDKATFLSHVEKVKAHLNFGDIQQVVLSQRLEVDVTTDPFHVYRVLRTLNPSPYMYCLQLGEETVVGASPELLVKVMGNTVETRPIAGTRKRGSNPAEDQHLAEQLLHDEKERAEHIMLVELGKEDIQRIADDGTVELQQFMAIERYSHVMHMVSHVTGQIKKGISSIQALLACMPAGTVSGTPKQQAMEMIAELERERRGVYAGGIGYLAFSGNVDTCIAIRTILFKCGKAYIQAGAGIVSASVPEKEYEETLSKAEALLIALAQAETMFRGVEAR